MECTQSISYGQGQQFFNYLSNCESDTIYPPFQLDSDESFYYVNGLNGKQISILNLDFAVILEGDEYDDPNQAIPQLLTMIKTVNEIAYCCGTNSAENIDFETAYVVKNVDELLALHGSDVSNRIPLEGKTYYFDSFNFEMGIYTLLVPTGVVGVHLRGFSQLVNRLSSTLDDISLIEVEDGSNLSISDLQLTATGVNSQAILVNGGATQSAIDLNFVEFTTGTNWGQLINYRQLFMTGCFSFGAKQGFSFSGATGGATLKDTRIINCGDYILGEDKSAGALPFTCNNVRSNVNATIDVGDFGFAFSEANFLADGGFEIFESRSDGGGQLAQDLSLGIEAQDSVKSLFTGNKGILRKNTKPGISWEATSQVATTISVIGTRYKLLGTTTPKNAVWLAQTDNNEITHQSELQFDYIFGGNLTILGTANDDLRLYLVKTPSGGSPIVLQSYLKNVSNIVGSNDVADFYFQYPIVTLDLGDTITLEISNETRTDDVTMSVGSSLYAYKL